MQGKPYPLFETACRAHKIPPPTREVQFCDARRWRFDFAWPDRMLALEIDGGAWAHGRHTRGAGFIGDMEKINEAQILGWTVLRCTPDDVQTGAVFALIARAISATTSAG